MKALIVVCIFTGIIHFAETTASCLRLAGIRTRSVATSLSFVNASLLVARFSNMLQAPFLGGMVDTAINRGTPQILESNFRLVILSAFIGNIVAAVMVPYFVFVLTKAIQRFEYIGSVPRLALSAFYPRNFMALVKGFRLPTFKSFKDLSLKGIPKTFLVLNSLMVGIYAIGVLASLYAGAQFPSYRVTAVQLSAIVNGIATILLTLMIDPVAAHITDQAIKGKRPEKDVRTVVFYLVIGRLVGTLIIAQLIFLPATEYIKAATGLVRNMFLQP